MAFQSEFVPLPFDKTWEMQKIIEYVDSMDTGGCQTYCELPMIWATKEKKEFDAFIVFTDNETSHGKVVFKKVDFDLRFFRSSHMKQ